MPRLIVNADDFGLHESINAAIAAGQDCGIVTSASLMALEGQPSFDQAVGMAKARPALAVGLHFALVGLPGLPTGYKGFIAEYVAGRFSASRIEELLNSQLDTLVSAGIDPTHIDSHQHLHALPSVMRIVCRVAAERKIPAVRLPLEQSPQDASVGRVAASRMLGALAALACPQIARHGLWRPDHFLGMAVSGHLTEAALLRLIERVPPVGVTEILCHPGRDNRALANAFAWGYDWESELAALTSARVRDRLQERGIALGMK